MGVITIKVPQQIRKTYQIASEKRAKQLIDSLDDIGTKKKLRDLSDVVGIWADRSESAEEIARELREKSNLGRNDDEFLLDANVLIALFRGNDKLKDFLESLDCAVDTTVYVELIQGAKNKTEVARIEKAVKTFPIAHFDKAISNRTIDLIRSYSKSHGLLLADAIIAATCIEKGLTLVTFNARDFRFIKGLKISVPKL